MVTRGAVVHYLTLSVKLLSVKLLMKVEINEKKRSRKIKSC